MKRTSITIHSLWAFALFALLSTASHAFNTFTVRVTVNSASTFGACWDEWCNKPDMFVAFYGQGFPAQAPACRSLSVIDRVNVGNPPPADWSCTVLVTRPGKLYIGLYDGDGPNSNNTAAQQIDIASGADLALGVNVESLAASPGTPFTFVSSGNDAVISYTVSSLINPGRLTGFDVTQPSFRPSTGEQVVFTAYAAGAPFVLQRVKAYNSAGAEVWNIFGHLDTIGQTSKTYVWQGRDPFGTPLPPGNYRITYQAFDSQYGGAAIGPLNGTGIETVGGMLVKNVTIAPPPVVPTLNVTGTNPAQKWAPDVGDLAIRVVSNAVATVSGEVWSSANCTGQKLLNLPAINLAPLMPGNLMWNGPVFTGGAFPLGMYGIKVFGTANGAATSPATICQPIEMIAAPPTLLYTQHAPFLALPGQTVEVTARSVDPAGQPRVVGRLDVFGSVQPVPGAARPAPTAPLRTCLMATSCTALVSLPTGGSFFSWRATAADRAQTTVADSGWRGQRVVSAASFAGATLLAVPADIAMNGPDMASMRDTAHSFDLLFSVSTDFNWNDPTDRQTIADGLDRFMSRLWGIEGIGAPAPTTFLRRPDLVRVYLTPQQNTVSWTPPANLCVWSAPSVGWADATAVLHRTNCRDNAWTWNRTFSAKLPRRDTIMHELHHALFGLADEYAAGDGGYFEAGPLPNIYNNVVDCLAQIGRDPTGCQPITEININNRLPTGRTFFRLDGLNTDVMDENGTQRFGDIRRANWMEGVCDAGGC